MLSFVLGDLTAIFRHCWRNQTHISKQLLERNLHYGSVCWEDSLKRTQEQYHEWRSAETSVPLNTSLTESCAGIWDLHQINRGRSTENIKETNNDRTKPFMGRGFLSVTTLPWSCKVTLCTLLVSLLLSTMVTTVSPSPIIEGQSNTEKESDSVAIPDPRNTKFVVEENIDVSIKSTWTSTYENTTLETNTEDELPDNVLFRSERSSGASAAANKNKKSERRVKENGHGEKGCSKKSLRVQARDLGLGLDSDEWITFFYCSGTCQQSRINYDIAVQTLLKNKRSNHSALRKVSSHPCCRPTSFQRVAVLDVENKWRVLEKLSAANCSCVG
ncbi:artemin [Hyperolius riggenbachi]|uniref:artemin n=1 Tax=Hyperolius riggenbachi TaxID=752182 RepID=UPI0035A3CDDF